MAREKIPDKHKAIIRKLGQQTGLNRDEWLREKRIPKPEIVSSAERSWTVNCLEEIDIGPSLSKDGILIEADTIAEEFDWQSLHREIIAQDYAENL